jgi:hypothetical protein
MNNEMGKGVEGRGRGLIKDAIWNEKHGKNIYHVLCQTDFLSTYVTTKYAQ